MKQILTITFLLLGMITNAQKYQYPIFERFNKTYSITSIEILKDKIRVDIDYLGSYTMGKYGKNGEISISKDTKLLTKNKEAKLISTANIPIFPEKTKVIPGKLFSFSLFFEKIDIKSDDTCHIYENPQNMSAMNFWNIWIGSNNEEDDYQKIYGVKDDYFISQIPIHISWAFYREDFIKSSDDLVKKSLNYWIEKSTTHNMSDSEIEDISVENQDTKTVYIIKPKNSAVTVMNFFCYNEKYERCVPSFDFYDKTGIAQKFFQSFANWYGANIRDNRALYAPWRQGRDVWIHIGEVYEGSSAIGLYNVKALVITYAEQLEMMKNKKQ